MNRRAFIAALPVLTTARALFAAAGVAPARIGICTFSCHQHWNAAAAELGGVQFTDAPGFYRYGRALGAEGVQTGLRGADRAAAREIRGLVGQDGGCFEAELRLPKDDGELDAFEAGVRLAREAGASVARAVCLRGRRYEAFQTREEFRRFQADAARSLALAEPVVRRHRLRLAIENHKDFTAGELLALLQAVGSEWVGALVDTGNNLALCEEPHAVVEALAPFAMSVHFKDMAVQPDADGFLLSEVPLGTGMLDLPRLIRTLRHAHPGLVFNLEMATRDPLRVPCRTGAYWATFSGPGTPHRDAALARVAANPPRQPPPRVSGKPIAQVLAEEEANNRHGLAWMKPHLPA